MNNIENAIILGAGASKSEGAPLQNELFKEFFEYHKFYKLKNCCCKSIKSRPKGKQKFFKCCKSKNCCSKSFKSCPKGKQKRLTEYL